MAIETWPAELPQIPMLVSGSSEPYQAPVETEMEDGPARARRSASATWTGLSYSYTMTAAQFRRYEAFVRDTLQHGTMRFRIPAWRPGAVAPLPLRLARITGGLPSWRPAGTHVVVTLPLKILDL